MIDQQYLKDKAAPIIRQSGAVYEKWKEVRARKANVGERIVTVTSDGIETENIAKAGDYVVENQTGARELYLVSKGGFADRYFKLKSLDGDWDIYRPTGKVIAIKLTDDVAGRLGFGNEIRFEAPWGSEQRLMPGDYLVCPPDQSEIYGIAAGEFHETYRKAD